MRKTINGQLLKNMVLSAAKYLDVNRASIDALNVFPVPEPFVDEQILQLAPVSLLRKFATTGRRWIIHNPELFGKSDLPASSPPSNIQKRTPVKQPFVFRYRRLEKKRA